MPIALWLAGCTSPGPLPPPATGDDDASLRALQVQGAALRPPFDPEITAYMVGFDEVAPGLVLEATPTDPDARVTLPPAGDPQPGDRLAIEVLAADGATRRTYEVVLLPPGFPEVSATVHDPSASGHTLLGTLGASGSWAMSVDHHGVPAWLFPLAGAVWDVRPGPDGVVSLITEIDGVPTGLTLDPLTGEELGRHLPAQTQAGPVPELDVHELERRDDGSTLLLGNVVQGGVDLSGMGGPADASVVHHVAQHLEPGGEVRFEWSTAGAVDFRTVPVWVPDPAFEAWVYGHANAAVIDPDDGHLVVSLRIVGQALKIATRDTVFRGREVPAGEVIWRLGGADSNFVFVDDDRADGWSGFAGQHTVRPVGDDRWIVFDNALRREATRPDLLDPEVEMTATGAPRFVEYLLDPEAGTATRIAEHAWPTETPVIAGGSAQRLANGHTVIGWGDLPNDDPGPAVTEIDAEGRLVLELTLPEGVWSYRAWRLE